MNRTAPARRSAAPARAAALAPSRPRLRIVRNLRVLAAAPSGSPRCRADAKRVAARLTYLPRVTVLPSREHPLLVVPPGGADSALAADADVLYLCAHSYPGPEPAGFCGTELDTLHGPLTAKVLVLDTCWGAAPTVRRALAAIRPAGLPPLALLAPAGPSPFDHHVLAGPLLEALLTGPRTGPWPQRLAVAATTALAGPELAPHAGRRWTRRQIHAVPGTATPIRTDR
ncbi:hypothetical protein [Streptomyces sp. NPDC056672]|uniref:hypothetical protein n=1 Tax=Streptomyces sp. NPDC056672 TaxID=3345906 RepID=UPI0036C84779